MVTDTRTEQTWQQGPLRLPLDLSEWVPADVLLQWTVQEIEALDWTNPQLTAYLGQRPAAHPKMFLQLLTYAYARGALGAGEIERVFYRDPLFRALGWNQTLRPKAISRFRRENRGLLKWSLGQVIQRAVRQQLEGGTRLLPGFQRSAERDAILRLDLARHLEHSAAED